MRERLGSLASKALPLAVLGRVVRIKAANGRALDLTPIIAEIRAAGAVSLREIAAGLNCRGILTARGGRWSAVQVQRVLARAFEQTVR